MFLRLCWSTWTEASSLSHFHSPSEVRVFTLTPIFGGRRKTSSQSHWSSERLQLKRRRFDLFYDRTAYFNSKVKRLVISAPPHGLPQSNPDQSPINLCHQYDPFIHFSIYWRLGNTLIIASPTSKLNSVMNYRRGATEPANCLHLINIPSNQCKLSVCSVWKDRLSWETVFTA